MRAGLEALHYAGDRTDLAIAHRDLLRIRAPRGSEFEDRRIRAVLELSARGRRLLPLLHKLDQTVREHEAEIGRDTVASFFEAAA